MADMWHILPQGQRQSTQLAPTGVGFADVWEITFQVDSGPATGTIGTVRVPVDLYTPDNVRDTINAQVAALDAVAGL